MLSDVGQQPQALAAVLLVLAEFQRFFPARRLAASSLWQAECFGQIVMVIPELARLPEQQPQQSLFPRQQLRALAAVLPVLSEFQRFSPARRPVAASLWQAAYFARIAMPTRELARLAEQQSPQSSVPRQQPPALVAVLPMLARFQSLSSALQLAAVEPGRPDYFV